MNDDHELQDILDELFTGPSPRYGGYERLYDPEVVIPNRLVNLTLRDRRNSVEVRDVTLFLGLQQAGGELWEHEVRSLLRLQVLGHPALPQIEDGKFDRGQSIAFVMTRYEGQPFARDWEDLLTQWAPAQPVVAFEQFSLLVDALCQLHGTRVMHRNLSLGAIRVKNVEGRPDRTTFSLARFEVSALLNNLLHAVFDEDGRPEYDEVVRALFLKPPGSLTRAHHLAYLPPERHALIFHDVGFRQLDYGSTDVFGLGVLGWELFVGPLVRVLRDECRAVEAATRDELPSALIDLHNAMRVRLVGDTTIPRPLRETLRNMLDSAPADRLTSFEASGELQQHWADICTALEGEAAETELKLIAFMPDDSVDTLYRIRGWIDHSPDTPEGCTELQAFLENELCNAELVHCHGGATGFVKATSTNAASQRDAQWVLIGEQAVWFCAFHYMASSSGRSRETHYDTLVIKYLTDKRNASEIISIRPRRRIGRVDLVPFRAGDPLDDHRAGRPSWKPLTEEVTTERAREDVGVDELMRQARFTLQYRGLMHRARQYPFYRRDLEDGTFVLVHDKEKDRSRQHEDALYAAYVSVDGGRLRPSLGGFAEELLHESEVPVLKIGGDRDSPYFGRHGDEVAIVKRLDDNAIVVRPRNGKRSVPEKGWLRPEGDVGSEVQLRREGEGVDALRQRRGLAKVLRTPRSIELTHKRDSVIGIPLPPDTKNLVGKADEIVAEMLRLHPFYALQGPPGTGKSTVVSRALHQYLTTEHGSRVLVSAQSNDALDQLAAKVVALLKPAVDDQSVLVLRELARSKDEKDLPAGLRWMTAEQNARALVERVRDRVNKGCDGAADEDEAELMRRWAAAAQKTLVELTERVRSSADVVFATCSIAGTLTDDLRSSAGVFDWVIVEEAAKAWPTEIIIPLVRGVRWTLVGDHRQLGPHRARDMHTFLEKLANHEHEQVALHHAAREGYEKFVRLFEGFFAQEREEGPSGSSPPVNSLDTQFRMHPDIAMPFAETFYGGIESGARMREERVHGLSDPLYLEGAPLVWLDTSCHEACQDEGFWYNLGEASLIEELVGRLNLRKDKNAGRLVVLTPYRQQVDKLSLGDLKGRVHTVHSFQGGESDIGIISLVRSRARGVDVRQNVGHTASPEVINVMLSRAKQLMIVVGNLPHFERYGGPDWASVIAEFRKVGRTVDAATGEVVR
ncbi:AAA domain-containing protein [Lentzea sp. NPDC102401]|uniref:AAA domain-containing protein n=1 Tax=Lentzea sp. NPDC102401 TaxID=3364128 RepID=UPI00380DB412